MKDRYGVREPLEAMIIQLVSGASIVEKNWKTFVLEVKVMAHVAKFVPIQLKMEGKKLETKTMIQVPQSPSPPPRYSFSIKQGGESCPAKHSSMCKKRPCPYPTLRNMALGSKVDRNYQSQVLENRWSPWNYKSIIERIPGLLKILMTGSIASMISLFVANKSWRCSQPSVSGAGKPLWVSMVWWLQRSDWVVVFTTVQGARDLNEASKAMSMGLSAIFITKSHAASLVIRQTPKKETAAPVVAWQSIERQEQISRYVEAEKDLQH